MIKESPELVAVISRWMISLQLKDRESLSNLFSKSSHLQYIGSDVNEIWSGDIIREAYIHHVEEIPEMEHRPISIEAFENGTTGWGTWIGEIKFSGSETFWLHRFSTVFTLEAGNWKLVHVHISNPKSNVEKMGVDHTAFYDLIENAKTGFTLNVDNETATVMFTDIVNSTSIASIVGDRTWAATIDWHIQSLTDHISQNNGTVVKTLGDGTMSTFPSATSALLAARSITTHINQSTREPAFKIRIGIHSGAVIQSKGDFFGTVVNKAARIAAAAHPGQILLSDITKEMADSNEQLQFNDLPSIPVRGIEGLHPVSELI